MLCIGCLVQLKRDHGQFNVFCLLSIRTKVSKIWILYNMLMANKWMHCLHRRACAGVCTFVVVGVACIQKVSSAPVHEQVRTLQMCLSASVYIFVNTLSTGYTHALVYAQFVYYHWRTRVGGVRLFCAGHLLLAWGIICDIRIDRGVVCIFSTFEFGVGVYVCVCVCVCVCLCVCIRTHAYTHCLLGTRM